MDPSGLTDVSGGVEVNEKTGTTTYTCKADMYPAEPSTDPVDAVIPGVEINVDHIDITVTQRLRKCSWPGICWFWMSDADKRKRREQQKRHTAYMGCLSKKCDYYCRYELPDIPDDAASQKGVERLACFGHSML